MVHEISVARRTLAWLVPFAIHLIVVLVCVFSRSPGEAPGFCGIGDHDIITVLAIFSGPLFSSAIAYSAIEWIVLDPTGAAVSGAMLFLVSAPVVIWSCVLCYRVVLRRVHSVWSFAGQFVLLYFYGMALGMLVVLAATLTSV